MTDPECAAIFEVTDWKGVFRNALLSSDRISIKTNDGEVSLSMADTARMLEKLQACMVKNGY